MWPQIFWEDLQQKKVSLLFSGKQGMRRLICILFIYLFIVLAVLGLCCCSGFSLVVGSGGYSRVAVLERLIVVASLISEHGFRAHGF